MLSIQKLLGEPNKESPAQNDPYQMLVKNPEEYEMKVREIAKQNRP